jgi:hypothetical protein
MQKPHEFIRFLANCYKIMKCYILNLGLFLCVKVCQRNCVVNATKDNLEGDDF